MWSYLSPRSLIAYQRKAALDEMGRRVAELHAQGYTVDADRLLDEMNDRKSLWSLDAQS